MNSSRYICAKENRSSGRVVLGTTLLVMLLFIRTPHPALAQADPRFDIFLQEDGLPNNQVQCIFQDKKGWMWIGTSQGLSRLDGYEFHNILPNSSDASSLHGNLIRVIKEDRKGNLLVGTENGGLNVFDRKKEKFSHPLDTCKELNYRIFSVNDIEEDGAGNLWIGTDIGIIFLDTTGNARFLDPLADLLQFSILLKI